MLTNYTFNVKVQDKYVTGMVLTKEMVLDFCTQVMLTLILQATPTDIPTSSGIRL
jgi:hypothetical protein